MFVAFCSLIICSSYVVALTRHNYDAGFFVAIFAIIIAWFFSRRIYQARYRSWNYDQQYGRPAIVVIDFLNCVLIGGATCFYYQTQQLTWFDGGTLGVVFVFGSILYAQGVLSKPLKIKSIF